MVTQALNYGNPLREPMCEKTGDSISRSTAAHHLEAPNVNCEPTPSWYIRWLGNNSESNPVGYHAIECAAAKLDFPLVHEFSQPSGAFHVPFNTIESIGKVVPIRVLGVHVHRILA